MAKLSSREAAAKKAGGSLNYKTGKITTPTKTVRTVSKSSKSSSSSSKSSGKFNNPNAIYGKQVTDPGRFPTMSYTPAQQKQVMQGQQKYYAANPDPKDYKEASKKKDKEYAQGGSKTGKVQPKLATSGNIGIGSFNSSSQRDMAAEAMNRQQDRKQPSLLQRGLGALGINQSAYNKGSIERTAEIMKDPLGLVPWARGMYSGLPGEKMYDSDQMQSLINGSLGINTVQGATLDQTPTISNYLDRKTTGTMGDVTVDDLGMAEEDYFNTLKNSDLPDEYKQDFANRLDQPNKELGMAYGWNGTPQVARAETNNNNNLALGSYPAGISEGVKYELGDEQQNIMDDDKSFDKEGKGLKKGRDSQQEALNALISQMSTEGQTTINEDKGQALGQLASLFAGYGTSDSEQRQQQQQRTNVDYAGKLAKFLSSLANQRVQGTNDINQSYNTAMGNLNQQRRAAAYQNQQLMRQAANDSFDRKYKMASLSQKNTSKIPGINSSWQPYQQQDFANQMLQQGYSWQDIADTARANNMDVNSGSYFDNYMRNINKLPPIKGNNDIINQLLGLG